MVFRRIDNPETDLNINLDFASRCVHYEHLKRSFRIGHFLFFSKGIIDLVNKSKYMKKILTEEEKEYIKKYEENFHILAEEEKKYIIKIKRENDIDKTKKELRDFFNNKN